MKASDSLPEKSRSLVRVQLKTPTGRTMLVVGLNSLAGAKRLALDLVAEGAVSGAAVQHRNKGVWKPAWRVVAPLMLALAAGLSGCATGTVHLGPFWAPKLTEHEQAQARRIERALGRLCQRAVETVGSCVRPYLSVIDGNILARYDVESNAITLPRRILNAKPEAQEVADAIVAHEFAHWGFKDARVGEPAYSRERNANFHATWVLVTGFEYEPRAAVRAVWRLLLGGLQATAKPSDNHPDACAELHDFERRANIIPTTNCTERTPSGGRA